MRLVVALGADALVETGEAPAGSMGPKLRAALDGDAGTRVVDGPRTALTAAPDARGGPP